MNRIIFMLIFSTCWMQAFSSLKNEAVFTIEEGKSKILVFAEFPSSIEQAVLSYQAELDMSAVQDSYEAVLFDYVNAHFTLLNQAKDTIQLLAVKKEYENVDSFLNRLIFEFAEGPIFIISNSFLFDIHEDQKNHHTIHRKGLPINFTTSHEQESFYVEKPLDKRYLMLALPVFLFISFFAFRKIWRTNKRLKRWSSNHLKKVE